MSLELGLQSRTWRARAHDSHRTDRAESAPLALLIEVPAVAPSKRQARRPSQSATERVRIWGVMDPPRPRRRLRREVRLAGYVLLSVCSLSTAVALLRGEGDSTAQTLAGAVPPPAVSLSIESSGILRPESAVVLPGYLLPADISEEPSHAGG